MSQNAVVWFEIYVNNMQRAVQFYNAVFEIELMALPVPESSGPSVQMMSFPGEMDKYGANGSLVKMEGVEAGGNSTMVYFGCEDCATEEARVARAGGSVVQSKTSIGEFGFMVIAMDTEGNRFGLHSMK